MCAAMEGFIDSRQVGAATITVISEGRIRIPVPWVLGVPENVWRGEVDADGEGRALFDHLSFHVRLGDASILIDAGLDDPERPPLPGNPFSTGLTRTPGLQAALRQIPVPPEEITHVLITHAHWDHYFGVAVESSGRYLPRYPNARYLLHRADWEQHPVRAQPDSDLERRLGAVANSGQLDLITGDTEIVPGVSMLHAPGESPGHCVVRIISEGETFYALGDLVHHAAEIEHPDWTAHADDEAALQASRERILAEAASRQALAVFSHALFPGWGRMTAGESGPRWRSMQ